MKSPLNYFGGKSKLAKRIVPMIPADHECYCEPFSGAAWVLFAKEPSRVEVINDLDGELVNFWRIVQNHLQPFLEYFKHAVISRKLFEIENAKRPELLTDLQRAVRYYYIQRQSYAGKTKGRTFNTGPSQPSSLNLSTIEESLLETHWRLQRVTIEHLHAVDCIERYDRPATFFYLDPPYFFSKRDYAVAFEDADFKRLLATLRALKGKFILSLNDCPEVCEMFRDFRQKRVTLTYSGSNPRTAAGQAAREKVRSELLIHNLA